MFQVSITNISNICCYINKLTVVDDGLIVVIRLDSRCSRKVFGYIKVFFKF